MNQLEAKAAVAAHYGMLMGIQSPWRVKEAMLDMPGHLVDIEVEYDRQKPLRCPQCNKACTCHDHAPERTWRHLDVMQFATQIRARVPRCNCPEHGVLSVGAPWAEPGSRFTMLFEAFAVEVLLASATLTQASELLGLDWDSVQRIMDRAVQRGLPRLFQAEEVFVAIIAGERGHQRRLARPQALVPEFREHPRVAFAFEDRAHDRLAAFAGDVRDDVVDLKVHLVERLVHVLHVPGALAHEALAVPPQAADRPRVRGRTECRAQKPD